MQVLTMHVTLCACNHRFMHMYICLHVLHMCTHTCQLVQVYICVLRLFKTCRGSLACKEITPNDTENPCMLAVCDLVKTEHPSFHYGQDGRTYLCQAVWNIKKCSLTREAPKGVDCLPKTSKLSNLPFRCRAVRGAGRIKLQLKVPKDLECQLIQADTP